MIIGISGKIGSGKDTIAHIIRWLTNPKEHGTWGNIHNFLGHHLQNRNNKSDWNWEIKKYADKLKDIVCLLIGCTREQLENQDFKNKELGEEWWYYKVIKEYYFTFDLIPYLPNKGDNIAGGTLMKITPRKLLQLIGTECGRQIIHPNIWVNATFTRYRNDIDHSNGTLVENGEYPNWIITDVRFPNEAEAIRDRGGILIRVNRSIKDRYIQEDEIFDGKLKREHLDDSTFKDLEKFKKESEHESETALDNYQDWNYTIDNNRTIEELVDQVETILKLEEII